MEQRLAKAHGSDSTACLQDMGMGGQVYDRQQIEQMYGKGGESFPGKLPAKPKQHAQQSVPESVTT